MSLEEDVEYTSVPEFARADSSVFSDVAEPYRQVLRDISDFLEKSIETDGSIDSLDLSKEAPLTLKQQVFLAQRDNIRLKTAKEFVDNKLKEIA